VIFGAACILVYSSLHEGYRAEKINDWEKQISVLTKAVKFYAWNPDIHFNLGNIHLQAGSFLPGDREKSHFHFEHAIGCYEKSLRLNPVSPYTHFSLGRTLQNLSFYMPEYADRSFAEYRKAALLSGHNTTIFFQTGKVFLSRWNDLSGNDREFTIRILRKIMENAEEEKIKELMQIWDMNVRDYDVMHRILPEKADVYRFYADFLGEKSLSIQERRRYLAEAEFIDYMQARELHEHAENEYFDYDMHSSFSEFQLCWKYLRRIKFYQNLTGDNLIDNKEYDQTCTSVLLYLVKAGVDSGRKFEVVKGYAEEYLRRENQVSSVRELDEFLQERRIIGKEFTGNLEDMDRFSFHVYLAYKENRYRDIMRIGRLIKDSLVMISDENRAQYVRILQMVGDANQKAEYIFDAVEFYRKALETDPENIPTLVRLRQSLSRLNKEKEVDRINEQINQIISSQHSSWKDKRILKRERYHRKLILDGTDRELNILIETETGGESPLISVFWNGKAAWEGYLSTEGGEQRNMISLPLETAAGENDLIIEAVNRDVTLLELNWY
jgi:tetratricopeptide (TPR) repeat protein